MYITLAGDGAEFTNRLFNTIEIQPNSYVCLNNLSIKKNEVINIGPGTFSLFKVDDNNFIKYDVPEGSYDVFTLCKLIENSINTQQTRLEVNFNVESNPDNSISILIVVRNAVQDVTTCLSQDTYEGVFDSSNVADSAMSKLKFFSSDSTSSLYDVSAFQTFRDIGPDSDTQSYSIQAADQTLSSSNVQCFGSVPFLLTNAPTYVTATGVPPTGWDSQDPGTNLIENAMIQADFQTWNGESVTPISVSNGNSEANEKLDKQADLLRHQGAITFIAGSMNSEKCVIISEGNQDDSVTLPPYPQNFNSFTTGSPGIYLWLHWSDPRDSGNESKLTFGFNKISDSTWATASGRGVTGAFEVTQAQEGNKFYIDFESQEKGTDPANVYAPRVRMNTLSYEHPLDDAVSTVAFWDMDVAQGNGVMFDGATDITFNTAQYTDSGTDSCGYKPLWTNVGLGNADGNYCSGHYWGTENTSDVNLTNGNDIGNGFVLSSGNGSIDFNHATGSFPATNTAPGYYRTAFGMSRSFQSAAAGYQNAYMKFPNMYGTEATRANPGSLPNLEGTVLPAQVGQSGTNTLSLCIRFDTATANQIIFAYEGVDSSNIPHALLAISPNSTSGITVSNGDPGVRETLNIFEADGTTPASFPIQKWINIVVCFQSEAGDSNWIVLGKDEDNNVYRATATGCSGSPKRPLYGIGGNDACDGSQLTNTGFGGLMKLFKIRYYHANSTSYGAAYNVTNLLASLMKDIDTTLGDDWFFYEGQIKSFEVLSQDDLSIGFKGMSEGNSTKAMTVLCGQHVSDTKISNRNPFDTLFSGLGYRQNIQPDLSLRVNQSFVDSGGDPIVWNFMTGGRNDTQLSPAIVAVQEVGSVYRELGFESTGGGGPFYIVGNVLPIENRTSENTQKSISTIDTELGINNNRIHLENLPIQSYNAKVGSVDRCVYQTTAFLNQIRGSDTTQISCIDVPQKIYIPLHNAGSINLNEFNVKITDIDDIVDPEVISSNMTIEIKNQEELKITN